MKRFSLGEIQRTFRLLRDSRCMQRRRLEVSLQWIDQLAERECLRSMLGMQNNWYTFRDDVDLGSD